MAPGFWAQPINVYKVVALVVILLVSLGMGLAPLRMQIMATPWRRRAMGYFTYFSAGVFLGAGLIHMLPDAADQYAVYLRASRPSSPSAWASR